MIDVEYINENGIDYIVFDKLNYKGTNYIYLVNENDELDFYIRKILIKDNKEYLINIDTEEEFKEILELFTNKQK